MGGRASLAGRGRKLRALPRRSAAQEEAVTMIQVRVAAGRVLAPPRPRPLPAGRPLRSAPLGGRGFYVAKAEPSYLRGGEESQGAGLRSGVLAASPSPTGGFPEPGLSPAEPRAPLGPGARTWKLSGAAAPVTGAEPAGLEQQRAAFLGH